MRQKPAPVKKAQKGRRVVGPRLLNRELSWLDFDRRVLDEALNPANPILERLKFLSIVESNLDEFFMVRVSGLIEQAEHGLAELSPDGLTPLEQIKAIMKATKPLRWRAADAWAKKLKPCLEAEGIYLRTVESLPPKHAAWVRHHFETELFPLCTPLLLHPAATVPFISNRSLNLLVQLEDGGSEMRLARVKIPTVVPRAIRLPGKRVEYVLLEDVIAAHLDKLFPGVKLLGVYRFRVVRDADTEIKELEAADLIASIEETIRLRRFGDPVLMEVQASMPAGLQTLLAELLGLQPGMVVNIDGLIAYDVFLELAALDRPALRFPPFTPYVAEAATDPRTLFETILAGDILLHHPYDSFYAIEQFVGSAAVDPDVTGIKQTLYRVGSQSPIVEALLDAGEEGKQVAAVVELKARFDESNNLLWARALERAGVHVTFGFREMKTHCKLSLIVRREGAGVRQYAHIGTGNYNPATARLYTDLGLFTCDPDITQDISELFNYLTGYSRQTSYRKLLVAPVNLREGVLELIHAEVASHRKSGKGRIILKVNALVDPEAIEALYEASRVGVKIDLIVRGICCLRPGVAGLSDRIRVVSIVGRFLEHSRIYYFENGGRPKVLIGSADLMRRNLDRRIEALTPVERPELVVLLKDILDTYLNDNMQSWRLTSSGEYVRRKPGKANPFDSQRELMQRPATRLLLGPNPATETSG
ncbi:MAG: polyphosphate kinase 1 [Fimbriimonadaceae bacterium]